MSHVENSTDPISIIPGLYEGLYRVSTLPNYRKFSIKGAGRRGKALGDALIRERAFPPSSGLLQNENRTTFG